MVKKIAYTDNGRIHVQSIDLRQSEQTHIDDYVSKGFTDAVIIESNNLPVDDVYDDAWELNSGSISVNMTTAKDIHRDLLRSERASHFMETDSLIMEIWSQRKDTSAIEARQAYLRDITEDPTIDAATNTTELSAVTIASWTPPVVKNVSTCDFKRTEVDSTTYTLTSADYAVGVVHTSTAAVTLTLPEISTIGQKKYLIKDEGGNAGTNTITINVSGSDTIDGASSQTISINYGVMALYNNGSTGWFVASND